MRGEVDEGATVAQLTVSLALLLFASTLLNSSIFPSLDELLPVAREISTFCGAAFFFILAAVAHWRPQLLVEGLWTAGSFLCLFAGMFLLYAGVQSGAALLVGVGAPIGGVGGAWFLLLAGLPLTGLSARGRAVALVSAAFVDAIGAAALCFVEVPLSLAAVGYLLCFALSYVLSQGHARGLVRQVREGQVPAEADVTNPYSFLPLGHPVYVAILLFNIACGCALSFRSTNSVPVSAPLACIPIAVLFVVVVVARRRLDADVLFYLSTLLAFAGFLLVPLAAGGTGGDPLNLSNTLLEAGSSCFSVLVLLLVASIGSRNLLAASTLLALSQGVSWLGVGPGAMLGHAANSLASTDATALLLANALLTFLFVAYNFVALRRFSFEETIAGIQPVGEVQAREEGAAPPEAAAEDDAGHDAAAGEGDGAPAAVETFEERCLRVAEAYKLTRRETDVFSLMAHGRSSSVIEERLVLSRNTIKTHVRNIYGKLGVHSQQELIDVVEDLPPRE